MGSERLKEHQNDLNESQKEINGLFSKQTLREKIKQILESFDEVYTVKPDAGEHIPKEVMPIVLRKISEHLSLKAKAMETEIVYEKIAPLVAESDENAKNETINKLKEEIRSLKNDINECPEGERFQQMKTTLKDELREKEQELLELESGTGNAMGLDLFDGASQLY